MYGDYEFNDDDDDDEDANTKANWEQVEYKPIIIDIIVFYCRKKKKK